MIRTFLALAIMGILFAGSPATAQTNQTKGKATLKSSPDVTVYYFHVTRRCPTCMAVEQTAKDFVEKTYKDGKVTFKAVNVDDEKNAELAGKYQAAGSLLLVVAGNKTEDLTADAFKYARSTPEKLEAGLKETIAKLRK